MPAQNKYTPEHKQFVALGWEAGKSARVIALDMQARFGIKCSRNAIISLADRMKLVRRATTGPWRVYAHKPLPKTTPKPKPPKPSSELLEPIAAGPLNDFPEHGLCRWPVNDWPQFQCCGQQVWKSGVYCEFHAHRAYDHTKRPMNGSSRSDRQFR